MIRVISGYRVSQRRGKHVGPMTACQQQFNSLVLTDARSLDPRQAFLEDMEKFIMKWKNSGDQNEVILLMDANEDLADGSSLSKFVEKTGLLDAVAELEPNLQRDPTYLWSPRRLDYVFITPSLQPAVVRAGHHPFHQHLVTDHKGVFVYFLTEELFDTAEIDGATFPNDG